jgi:hypothetical protein
MRIKKVAKKTEVDTGEIAFILRAIEKKYFSE